MAANSIKIIDRVFIGAFVHSLAFSQLELCPLGAIGIDTIGRIVFVRRCPDITTTTQASYVRQISQEYPNATLKVLSEMQFLIPGFIDCHTHAPQYVNTGLGLDLPLLDWLHKYTFPREQEFSNIAMAQRVYPATVRRLLSYGTTTACYYGTIHLEANKYLVDVCERMGQRAFIGKVNMDRNSPPELTEPTQQSIDETRAFIEYTKKKSSLVTPVITPRFAPSCTPELLKALGQLAQEFSIPVQTHLSENLAEMEWVRALFPSCRTYTEVYDIFHLLTSRCLLGHGIHLAPSECALLKQRGAGVVHCPNSNFSIVSGVCRVRWLVQKQGVKVGLGTDVSGGYHPSMLDAVKSAILASKVLFLSQQHQQPDQPTTETKSLANEEDRVGRLGDVDRVPLTTAEAFYLATLGGAELLGIQETVGSFAPGKEFDAVLVDLKQLAHTFSSEPEDPVTHPHHHAERHASALKKHGEHLENNIDVWHHDDLASMFDRFIYLGDDRNVVKVWVRGKLVKATKSED